MQNISSGNDDGAEKRDCYQPSKPTETFIGTFGLQRTVNETVECFGEDVIRKCVSANSSTDETINRSLDLNRINRSDLENKENVNPEPGLSPPTIDKHCISRTNFPRSFLKVKKEFGVKKINNDFQQEEASADSSPKQVLQCRCSKVKHDFLALPLSKTIKRLQKQAKFPDGVIFSPEGPKRIGKKLGKGRIELAHNGLTVGIYKQEIYYEYGKGSRTFPNASRVPEIEDSLPQLGAVCNETLINSANFILKVVDSYLSTLTVNEKMYLYRCYHSIRPMLLKKLTQRLSSFLERYPDLAVNTLVNGIAAFISQEISSCCVIVRATFKKLLDIELSDENVDQMFDTSRLIEFEEDDFMYYQNQPEEVVDYLHKLQDSIFYIRTDITSYEELNHFPQSFVITGGERFATNLHMNFDIFRSCRLCLQLFLYYSLCTHGNTDSLKKIIEYMVPVL